MIRFAQLPVKADSYDKVEIRSFNLSYVTDFRPASEEWIKRGFASIMFVNDLDEENRLIRVALSYDELHAYLDKTARS